MDLQAETSKVVSQFEFSDADVNIHVSEFLKQMSVYPGAKCLSPSRKG